MSVETTTRKTVLFVIGSLTVGGAEQVLIDTALGLNKETYRVIVCSLSGPGEFDGKLAGTHVEHVILNKGSGFAPGILWPLTRLMRTEGVDIVHAHLFTGNTWASLAALLACVPRVFVTHHSIDTWKGFAHRLTDRMLSPLATKIICVSEAVKQFYQNDIGLSQERLLVIPNGIAFPIDISPCSKLQLHLPEDKLIVGTVGRLTKAKNYSGWLDAFQIMQDNLQGNCHGVIVGDGELKQELEQWIKDRNLSEQITLLGHRDDINAIYPLMDLFMLSSEREGMPIVVLEAMAHNLAVVATDVGGMRELIPDVNCGLLVAAGDMTALALAGIDLLQNNESRLAVCQNAFQRLTDNFTLRGMLQHIEELYQSAAKGL